MSNPLRGERLIRLLDTGEANIFDVMARSCQTIPGGIGRRLHLPDVAARLKISWKSGYKVKLESIFRRQIHDGSVRINGNFLEEVE
jgi:hypothetical protein